MAPKIPSQRVEALRNHKGGRPHAEPHLRRVHVPVRLPAWLVEWIDAQAGTRADVIEAALLKAHKIKPPN